MSNPERVESCENRERVRWNVHRSDRNSTDEPHVCRDTAVMQRRHVALASIMLHNDVGSVVEPRQRTARESVELKDD